MRFNVKLLLVFFLMILVPSSSKLLAQGGFYGVQISPGFSTQKWNGQSRSSLLTLNADVYMSAYGEDETNIYYLKGGYHQRGSSVNVGNLSGILNTRLKYIFHNAVVGVGVKKMLKERFGLPFYYLLGLRLEYTVGTNLSQYKDRNTAYYPIDYFVNKFNYGTDFGGGFIFQLNGNYDLYLELLVSPDFSLQYEQDPIANVVDPYHPSQLITVPKRQVRNLSFEFSIGLRLLQ